MRTPRQLSALALPALALAVSAAPVQAQSPWSWDIQLGGSAFFGEVEQTALTSSVAVERADQALELSSLLGFDYGETRDAETDRSVVSRRSWRAVFAADVKPESTWSVFGFGTGERSFEKRIDFRYNVGGGTKYTLVSNDTSRVDLSGALLAEQTFPRGDAASPSSDLLARLSFRFRVRHVFGSGDPDQDLRFDTSNSYAPRVSDFGNYTFLSRTSLDYPLTGVFSIGASVLYDFDSLGTERGAVSNHMGKIFLNFGAEF